jgi:hypothetical protein
MHHQRESVRSPFVFVSERGAPISPPGFSRMVERAALTAKLGIKAHAHMLRHACGYKLANEAADKNSAGARSPALEPTDTAVGSSIGQRGQWLKVRRVSARQAAPPGSHSQMFPNDVVQNFPPAHAAFGRVVHIAGNASRLGPPALADGPN